jgi:DNA-binding PadR family transcriptional regulator
MLAFGICLAQQKGNRAMKASHPEILQIIDGDERYWLIRHKADGHQDHVMFRTTISGRAERHRAIFEQIVDSEGAKAVCMRLGSDLSAQWNTEDHFAALFDKFKGE